MKLNKKIFHFSVGVSSALMLLMSVVPTQAGIISGDLSDLFKDKRYYKRILWHRPDLFSPNYGGSLSYRLHDFENYIENHITTTQDEHGHTVKKLPRMPYLASSVTTCKDKGIEIKTPGKGSNDGGFLLDKDCETLYVFPPKFGRVTVDKYATGATAGFICNSVNSILESVTLFGKMNTSLDKEKTELLISADSSPEKLQKITRQQRKIIEYVSETLDALDPTLGRYLMTASISYSLDWDTLIRNYQKLNPGITVVRLPIARSILTYTQKIPDSLEDLMKGYQVVNPVISSYIPVAYPGHEGKDWFVDGRDLEPGPVLFSNSATGQLMLNGLGGCSMLNTNGEYSPGRGASITPFMTANLVYTYPVQTTAGYTVQFDVESFSQLIESKIWKNGKITSNTLVEKLMSDTTQEMLKITLHEDAFGGSIPGEQIDDIKRSITEGYVHTILDKVGNLTGVAPEFIEPKDPTDPSRTEIRSGHSCSRKKFFGIKYKTVCNNYTYTVKVSVDAIKKALREFKTTLKTSNTTEMISYRTYMQNGSTGFVEDVTKTLTEQEVPIDTKIKDSNIY